MSLSRDGLPGPRAQLPSQPGQPAALHLVRPLSGTDGTPFRLSVAELDGDAGGAAEATDVIDRLRLRDVYPLDRRACQGCQSWRVMTLSTMSGGTKSLNPHGPLPLLIGRVCRILAAKPAQLKLASTMLLSSRSTQAVDALPRAGETVGRFYGPSLGMESVDSYLPGWPRASGTPDHVSSTERLR